MTKLVAIKTRLTVDPFTRLCHLRYFYELLDLEMKSFSVKDKYLILLRFKDFSAFSKKENFRALNSHWEKIFVLILIPRVNKIKQVYAVYRMVVLSFHGHHFIRTGMTMAYLHGAMIVTVNRLAASFASTVPEKTLNLFSMLKACLTVGLSCAGAPREIILLRVISTPNDLMQMGSRLEMNSA